MGNNALEKHVLAIDPDLAHVGLQIQSWIDSGLDVKSVKPGGEYMDIGTIDGIKNLYRKLV